MTAWSRPLVRSPLGFSDFDIRGELRQIQWEASQKKLAGDDWRALGDRTRVYRRGFEMLYDAAVHNNDTQLRKTIEEELFKLEKQLYPWVINGNVYKSALAALLASTGRGIVMTTGSKYALVAKHSITILRMLGSKLPIQVMYCGPEDLGEPQRKMLSALPGVEVIDMKTILAFSESHKGWENKPFAVLASSFREVILMDADALFFQPPEVLFEMEGYKKTGALLFRDRTLPYNIWGHGPGSKHLMEQIADPYINNLLFTENRLMNEKSGDEIDSGVVVWDKLQVMPVLLLTCLLNDDPYKGTLYHKSYGDKESFWFAHEAMRIPFGIGPGHGGAIGELERRDEDYRICGGMFHPDEHKRPLWFNGGIGKRTPSQDLEIRRPEYWVMDYKAVDVPWDLDREPFCLRKKKDPNHPSGTELYPITGADLVTSKRMVKLWIELFQL
eukprot:jgi/Hompol1/256/HPOL_001145-RA